MVSSCQLLQSLNLPFYKLIIKFPWKYRLIQLKMSQECPKRPPFLSRNYNSVYSKIGIPWHSYEQTCVGNTIFDRILTTEDESYGFEGSHGLKLISQIGHYSTCPVE